MNTLSGRLIIGQSGGCTHVINSSLRGVVEAARRSKAVTGIWGMRHGIEGVLSREIVDLERESADALRAVGRVPAAALGSCRRRITDQEAREIVGFFERNLVRYFVYIGGNDSADTAHRVSCAARRARVAMRIVVVPKTIDNDLPCTHHCPGFGSAARFLASVAADTGAETEAMHTVEPVKVIEVMGRNAGWLPCAAALAKRSDKDAPQFVWPPEEPFDKRKFLRLVGQWLERLGYCVVVVTETLRDRRGRPVGAKGGAPETDAFGHPRITGAAAYLCGLAAERYGVRARWDKPGTIQRMSSAHCSNVDLREARACGQWAVRFALAGRSDCMVVMKKLSGGGYRIGFDTAPIGKVANREKRVPASYFDADTMLPTAAFRRYALPIIGGGLPRHARLRGRKARIVR